MDYCSNESCESEATVMFHLKVGTHVFERFFLCANCLAIFQRGQRHKDAQPEFIRKLQCNDCGEEFNDPIETTSIEDHGCCVDCHKQRKEMPIDPGEVGMVP